MGDDKDPESLGVGDDKDPKSLKVRSTVFAYHLKSPRLEPKRRVLEPVGSERPERKGIDILPLTLLWMKYSDDTSKFLYQTQLSYVVSRTMCNFPCHVPVLLLLLSFFLLLLV